MPKRKCTDFFELRYAIEYTELVGNMYFIPDLMITLHNIIESESNPNCNGL